MPSDGTDDLDIRFCDRCAQSIPDGDFENGRAITVDGRHLHLTCAMGRSLGLSGPRSWLTFGLALYAAAVTTFLLVLALQGGPDPNVVPAAVEARIEAAREDALALARQEHAGRLAELEATLQRQRAADAEREATEIGQHLGVLKTRLDEYERVAADNHRELVARLQRQKEELTGLERVFTEAIQRAEAELARVDRIPPQEPPTEPAPEPPPAPEPAPPPEPATPGPLRDPDHEAEVNRWIDRLADPNDDIRFTATLELGRLKDRRAAPALIRVLGRDRDYVVRLGAATALGNMESAIAVPALIDRLVDKEGDVRTAAKEALQTITRHVIELDAPKQGEPGRRAWGTLKSQWATWWRANEATVRERLGQ